VELIVEDTAGDPKQAVSAATKLFSVDGVKYAVIGTSASTAAVAPLADQYKSLVITDAAGYGLTKGKNYLMQNLLPSLNDVAVQINNNPAWKKVAVIYINDEFGLRWADNTKADVSKDKTVELFSFEKTATDFKTQAAKIKQFSPDVLFVIGYGPALNQAHADMKTLGINVPELTYLSCTLPGVLTDTRFSLEGKNSYEYPEAQNRTLKNWITEKGGSNSTFYSLAFENTLAILVAADKTNSDVDKTISYLKNTGVDGLYGFIKFDVSGVVERDLVMTKVEGGKCVMGQ
jgi:ABC-type branched-subunit amino acid transport system substrate-binding protein